MIRNLQFRDLEVIRRIPISFPFPNLDCGLYCSQKALIDKDKVVGTAMLKLTSEAVIILDPHLSSITKASLIQEAFKTIPDEMDKFGLDQIHVFVIPDNDVSYAALLQKHFHFERAKGIPLVYTKNG